MLTYSPDFQWVEGDRCEVLLHITNPSSYELRITNIQLLTEDIDFEPEPASVVLSPGFDHKATPVAVILNGTTFSLKLFFVIKHYLAL